MNTTKYKPFENSVSSKLNKKGAEMALGMIITIIILLLVVVIVVFLLARSSDTITTGASCPEKRGFCSQNPCENGEITDGLKDNACPGGKCCRIVGEI